MANGRGFADINPYEGAAGIVLPNSETTDYAIDQIARNGVLAQKQRQADLAYKAQVNKDFSTNKLAIEPTIQYNSELSGLAQKWYDKGVGYRRQNFDPFNPNYNIPSQVAASEQYLAEKKHIEDLSELAKGVDKDYQSNKKLAQEGKIDGFDDYTNALKTTSLQDLHKKGGLSALPQPYDHYSTQKVDADVKIPVETAEQMTDVPGMPGMQQKTTHEYIDGKKAVGAVERSMAGQPSYVNHVKKLTGVTPDKLFTVSGHFMKYDPSNPADVGTIDQPAIMHQMAVDLLTTPEGIKSLPAGVKKKIIGNASGWDNLPGSPMGLSAGGASAQVARKQSYDPTTDPEFQQFLNDKFKDQLQKEVAYRSDVIDGVIRNTPKLSDKTVYDNHIANYRHQQAMLGISQQHLNIAADANNRANAKWNATQNPSSLIEASRTGPNQDAAWHALSAAFQGNPDYGGHGLVKTVDAKNPNILHITVPGKVSTNKEYNPNYETDRKAALDKNGGDVTAKNYTNWLQLNAPTKNKLNTTPELKFSVDKNKKAEYHAAMETIKKRIGGDKEDKAEGNTLNSSYDNLGGDDTADDL